MENQNKNFVYIYSSWAVLTLNNILPIYFLLFLFIVFPTFYYKFATLSYSLHIFPYKKGYFPLSLSPFKFFFFSFFVEIFYFSCIFTLDWWILLTNSYVFLDASIFFFHFLYNTNTFNELCLLLILFEENHIIICQILCCFRVLIYLENNKIV